MDLENCERLLGLRKDGLEELAGSPGYFALPRVCADFSHLRADALASGIDLRVESAFRSFERQVEIWNGKARGERPVLDKNGRQINVLDLAPHDRVATIMLWSALPGTSRHHWGTDLDIVDAAAIPLGYQVQLIPEEVGENGMFGPLHTWLDKRISQGQVYGFFRPYTRGRGSIRPERWHISHGGAALQMEKHFSPELLRKQLEKAKLELLAEVLNNLEVILQSHVYPYFGGHK